MDTKIAQHVTKIAQHVSKIAQHVTKIALHVSKIALHVSKIAQIVTKIAHHVSKNSTNRHKNSIACHKNSTARLKNSIADDMSHNTLNVMKYPLSKKFTPLVTYFPKMLLMLFQANSLMNSFSKTNSVKGRITEFPYSDTIRLWKMGEGKGSGQSINNDFFSFYLLHSQIFRKSLVTLFSKGHLNPSHFKNDHILDIFVS